MKKYVIGVDYGSDSCRALLVDAESGEELAVAVAAYERWHKGLYCEPSKNCYRQHPNDYIESLETVVRSVVSTLSKEERNNIVAMAFDTTGSTPVIVNAEGTPLSLLPEFANEPDAMFVLWKDHTSTHEAEIINRLAHAEGETDYTAYSGGTYSSEWVWAKVAHIVKTNERVHRAAYSWVEHCDWMPALLTGCTVPEVMKRGRCAAGHKAMWHKSWNGLPDMEFLRRVEPALACFEGHLYSDTVTSDTMAGTITSEWAERLGLPQTVVIGMGAIDAHVGAIGAGIKPYAFVRVMGTSTCDMMVVKANELGDRYVKGICGQVEDAILPGYVGLEAGQSAFGDVYAWLKHFILTPVFEILGEKEQTDGTSLDNVRTTLEENLLNHLAAAAENTAGAEDTSVLALDWFNGRRTPFVNQNVAAAVSGLTLSTSAVELFRALVEATAYGSKAIIDLFTSQGVRIDYIIAIGGIASKSPFVMQTLANVIGKSIRVADTTQTCALGSAMIAATASGVYPSLAVAIEVMGKGCKLEYRPDMRAFEIYKKKLVAYKHLGEYAESIVVSN